jgi:hypothetical protein
LLKFAGGVGSGFVEIAEDGSNADVVNADVIVALIPGGFGDGFLIKAHFFEAVRFPILFGFAIIVLSIGNVVVGYIGLLYFVLAYLCL